MANNQNLLDNLPFYFRVGSVGAGVGVGCGVGVGFGQPLNLAAVPGLGQVMAGVSSGLGQVSGLMGGMGTGAREAVRRLGVGGLDAGFGCGVGIGYGFGAGVFLKPSAAHQLGRLLEETASALTQQVATRLHDAGIALPHPPDHNPAAISHPPLPSPSLTQTLVNRPLGGVTDQLPYVPPQQLPWHQPSPSPTSSSSFSPVLLQPGQASAKALGPVDPRHAASVVAAAASGRGLGHGVTLTGTGSAASRGDSAAQDLGLADRQATGGSDVGLGGMSGGGEGCGLPPPPPEEFRALLRHERQIARLRAQNRALRRAVCRLNHRLPLCADSSSDEKDDDD